MKMEMNQSLVAGMILGDMVKAKNDFFAPGTSVRPILDEGGYTNKIEMTFPSGDQLVITVHEVSTIEEES